MSSKSLCFHLILSIFVFHNIKNGFRRARRAKYEISFTLFIPDNLSFVLKAVLLDNFQKTIEIFDSIEKSAADFDVKGFSGKTTPTQILMFIGKNFDVYRKFIENVQKWAILTIFLGIFKIFSYEKVFLNLKNRKSSKFLGIETSKR